MQTVTELIIDLSGSMKDKITLTKKMLISDIIPNLDYSSRIGIKSFSAVKDQPPIIEELPLNIIDLESIIKTISNLQVKNGGTPISEAIRQSVLTLKEYPANEKKIILITDGEEDKGGDYVNECKKARTDGINCEIHVIGVGLNQQAQKKAQEISTLTNGTFSNIPFPKDTSYDEKIIKTNLSAFYDAVNYNKESKPLSIIEQALPVNTIQTQKEVLNKFPKIEQDLKADVESEIIINSNTFSIKDNDNNKKIDQSIVETNLTLQALVKEIKEIREEIKNLKTNTNLILEVKEDTELNEKIRLISEQYLFEILKIKYPNRVKWLNENGESYLNHDFEILEEDGSIEYYIECKGTAKHKTTFYVTKNEWKLFLNNTKNYQIYFIQNVLDSPKHIFINNLLDWLLRGKIYPYLKTTEIIKEERVFLTVSDTNFIN